MSAEKESSEPRRREGQSRRPAYYRNSQGRTKSSAQRYNHTDAEYDLNNLPEDPASNYLNHSAASNSRNFNTSNFKPDNFRGPHKQQFSRLQYNPPNQSNYKNSPNYHIRGSRTNNNNYFHRNQDSAREQYSSEAPDADQRGQIVGGRYIRRHQNQVHQNNSRERNQPPSETNFQSDRTSYKEHNFSRNSYSNYSYNNKNTETYIRPKASQNQSNTKDYCDSAHSNNVPSRNYDKKFSNSSYHSASKFQNKNSAESDAPKKLFNQNPSRNSHQSSDVGQDSLATQRELLISRLTKGESECLVCCELIRVRDQTWHCLSCYHVFHLRCIKKWARSPAASVKEGDWRCPACQSLNSDIPFNYYCFCGKNKNPDVNYHLTPHSCGEICDRLHPDCPHHCKELCHPGPCPPCVVVIQKACPCGKSVQTLPCNQAVETTCQSVCDKLLNCGVHRCKSLCHTSACISCEETIVQKCHCGKCEREVTCTEETSSCFVYSCGDVCERGLNCANHTCQAVCHPGACEPCQRSVEKVRECCCGRSSIVELVASGKAQERATCLDPIPTCGSICGKKLLCGPKDDPHTCQSLCHESNCPPCSLTTSLKCRCGAFTKEFPCAELSDSFVYMCEKRCNRRKDCGRHKCLNNCCINFEHKCELVCNKKLSCGLHQCQETCHAGNCPTCWNVSFQELCCHCGESVLFPPIACGTKPPECNKPCIRNHPCGHDVKHTCHSDASCPPCTSLTTKLCYGGHKQCGPVMCFLEGVSCGMPCQKPLPCGRHKCKLTCHPGDCQKDSEKCSQMCPIPRPSCGHPCNSLCHEGPCPETPCKFQVTSNCPCGHRSETTTCHDSCKSYRLMSSQLLATKMQEIKEGQSVNLSDVLGKKSKNSKLQCNEECALIERNKRLAVALQIQNPDLSASPGPPSYSEFLKDEARKSPQLVSDIYDKLCNLVQLAKQSKQKCRSHSFPPMNRDHRRIVHELAEFFGCETQSYDEEPKKNVVVTAHKNRCWLPFTSIMSVVQRDMGIRKGPTPVTSQRDPKTSIVGSAPSGQKKKIDYFDYKE